MALPVSNQKIVNGSQEVVNTTEVSAERGTFSTLVSPLTIAPVISSNTTASSESTLYPVDSSAGTFTVTLDGALHQEGNWLSIKDAGGNSATNGITVATSGSSTIDGSTSITISTNYASLKLYSDGTNWLSASGSGGSSTL